MCIVRVRALLLAAGIAALAGCPRAAPPPPAVAPVAPVAMTVITAAGPFRISERSERGPAAGSGPRPTLPPADAESVQPPVRPFGDSPPHTKVSARATIAAVGDVLLHDGVQKCAALHATEINCDGYDELYKNVSQYLAAADLTFANVETPITLEAPNGTGAFQFNAPPASIKALQRAGIDVVSFANNHVYDQGRRGFRESMDILDLLGLPFAGAGRTRDEAYLPRIFDVNGMKIAFLAFTELLNDITKDDAPDRDPHVAIFDIKRAEKAVRAAAKQSDAVIVSAHWGTEYVQKPGKYQVDKAHRMIAAGAIAVIGHHPHVLQPIELYKPRKWDREGVIAYSLGNFISNQGMRYGTKHEQEDQGPRREGALLRIELVRRDYGGGISRVEVEGIDALPLWTENDIVRAQSDEDERTQPDIHVVALDRAIANVTRELAKIPQPIPPELVARYGYLRRWQEIYLSRKESIRTVLGDRYIREIAPPTQQTAASP